MFWLTNVIPERIVFVSRGITVLMNIPVLILQHYCYIDMSFSIELFVHCTYTSLLQLVKMLLVPSICVISSEYLCVILE